MKLALNFILLLIHYVVSALLCAYIGDYISQPLNIGLVLLGGLSFSLIMVSLIKHTSQFILRIKNNKQ
jgi:uncharacterized membrane-anchored protein